MSYYTYILGLTKGFVYVGMSSDPVKRIFQHFNGNGAKWTQKHQPLQILSFEKHKTYEKARQRETEKYYEMKKLFGIDKVRGAGHTKSN
jgi:putative endonuclease